MQLMRRAFPWLLWSVLLAAMTCMGIRNNPGGVVTSNPRSLTDRRVTSGTEVPSAAAGDCNGQGLNDRSQHARQ